MGSGLWTKCAGCGEITYSQEFVQNLRVCPVCGHHHPLPTRERIAAMLDKGSWEELDLELRSGDPLQFQDQKAYKDRVKKAEKNAGKGDAFASGVGRVAGVPVSAGFFVFEFMGGSMGSV
ncbi:MAG: acetyl-CoA carboxylase carboxyl transferase subunit beta, partial [Myxococcales bacterium]|nr:acetyl-CoA carboxylase carboxyl transferase subunit beta [Myxococcales bacterium]